MFSYFKYVSYKYKIILISVIILLTIFNIILYSLGYEFIKYLISSLFIPDEMFDNFNKTLELLHNIN